MASGAGDDSLSSSELRRRYLQEPKDGGIEDSSLTTSQLRARYGIQGRNHDNNSKGAMSPVVLAVLVRHPACHVGRVDGWQGRAAFVEERWYRRDAREVEIAEERR